MKEQPRVQEAEVVQSEFQPHPVPAPMVQARPIAQPQIIVAPAPVSRALPYVAPKKAVAPIVAGLVGNLMAMLAVFLPVVAIEVYDVVYWFQEPFRVQAVIILGCSLLGLLMTITVRWMQVLTALGIMGALVSVWMKIAAAASDYAGQQIEVFDIFAPSLGTFLLVGGAALAMVSALWP